MGFILPSSAAASSRRPSTLPRQHASPSEGEEVVGGAHTTPPQERQAKQRPGHGHGKDRRQQLLSFTKTVVLGSFLASGCVNPSSLLAGRSQSQLPLFLGGAAPAAWAAEAPVMDGVVVNKLTAMSTGKAAALIEAQCQPILEVYKAHPTQRFLYRGEDIHRPTLVACPPDLLDPVTYREADATAFFARVDEAMATAPDAATAFTVRPSTGHLATSDVRCAAAWGTPCSIWPLGPLHYTWFESLKEWWPMPEAMRAPTKDVGSLRRFLQKEARVDQGLSRALSKGHEVLLKCELPAAGGAGAGVTYGFLAVPIAYERELRARLGLKYD